MEELNSYMENLDEYINDENKLVTYKLFSITHGLPYNVSKRLLFHYISQRPEDSLHVTYFVSGVVKSEKQIINKVSIVAACDLETTKESFDEVLCVHVYSLSKSELKDQASALFSTDYDCVKNNLQSASQLGGINSTTGIRSDADTAILREKATYRPSTPEDSRKATDPRLVKTEPTTRKEETKKQTTSTKGNIASMFANKNSGISKVKVEKPDEDVKPTNKALAKATAKDAKKGAGKNISGFFMKGVSQRQIKEEVEESTPEVKKSPVKKCPEVVKKSPEVVKKSPKKAPPKKTLVKQSKRSRIMKLDSDSSEDEEEAKSESEDEEPLPPTPPLKDSSPPPKESSPPPAPSSQRGKKRKLLDKTYEDEDGFFVTKKEYVDVTDSESEDPIPSSPPSKKQNRGGKSPPKQPKVSPSKTKQASIMNFFRKK